MLKPLGRVLFCQQSSSPGMDEMTLEEPFLLGFHACFQNAGVIRVYVMAIGFGMLFYLEADDRHSHSFQACVQPYVCK